MTKRTTPEAVAMQFALWGLIGGAGFCATLLARHLPGYVVLLAPTLAFFVSGALAGRSLGAGAVGAVACGVTFTAGGMWALLSAVATQGMHHETALGLMGYFGLTYTVAFGVGAGTGFALAPRHGLSVLGAAVLWFSLGGALAGVLVGAVVASGLGGRTAAVVAITIAVDLAFTIGGAGVARALDRSAGSLRHGPVSSTQN